MDITLPPASLRVLGALMEKEMVTPDIYPLSLNALVAAANQRSSRDPVTNLSDDDVTIALDNLQTESLVIAARDGGRVTKYEHRIRTVLNLRRDETAVLCLLLLRGAQTPGELRSRSDRMFPFEDLAQVQSTLERLSTREIPLVCVLERAPGAREVRWIQLLGGPPPQGAESDSFSTAITTTPKAELLQRIADLESKLQDLESRLEALEQRSKPENS